jgi:hypothetical protein
MDGARAVHLNDNGAAAPGCMTVTVTAVNALDAFVARADRLTLSAIGKA